jgi:hypothetical protein
MNTTNQVIVEQQIETALAQLPVWHAPPDFAARLAAAAARQATAPVTIRPAPAWDELIPVTLSSLGLAAMLAWGVPWSQLTGDVLVWTCVSAMSAGGAFLTMRVLRTP